MPRQRNVYPTTEIAHLWAHQTQESARNQQGNFYFNGDTIYSYRNDWPLARLVNGPNGANAVLINEERYSVTTTHHLNLALRSIPVVRRRFNVGNNVDLEPIDIFSKHFAHEVRTLKQSVAEAKNKVSKAKRYQKLTEYIERANRFSEFFALGQLLEVGDISGIKAEVEAELAAIQAKAEADYKKRQAAEKRAQRKRDLEMAEHIEAWKRGEHRSLYNVSQIFLRIVGNEVETSRGARFPVRHALHGLELVKRYLGKGMNFRDSHIPPRLGHYHIDRIDAKGNVSAGCHYVEYSEIQRIAPQLEAAAQTPVDEPLLNALRVWSEGE